MAGLLRSWPRWLLPAVLALVFGVSMWSWNRHPASSLMAYAPVPPGAQVLLGFTDQRDPRFMPRAGEPCPAWRMHLRIDPGLRPPGPAWTIFEGDHAGSGYELHWLPERLVLQVIRAPDQVLGSLALPRMPEEVVFVRRGLRLQIWIDGHTRLNCTDPGGQTGSPTAWGFHAAGSLGSSNLSLYDDRDLLDATEANALTWLAAPAEPSRAIRRNPLLMVRSALLAERPHAGEALAWAVHSVGTLGRNHREFPSLNAWLEWDQLRLGLPDPEQERRQDERDDILDVDTVLEHLETLTRSQPTPETTGMFLSLIDQFARLASQPPRLRMDPNRAFDERDHWLRLVRAASDAVQRLDRAENRPLPDHWRWQLRLVSHAARCLMGPQPAQAIVTNQDTALPAEAPTWVVGRWQALSGDTPGSQGFGGPIPGNPSEEGNPIAPALNRLLTLAGLEPQASPARQQLIANTVEATSRLSELADNFANQLANTPLAKHNELRRKTDEDITRLLSRVPEREAALTRALLALRGIGSAEKAHETLYPRLARERSASRPNDPPLALAEIDPLAYAIDRLLVTRILYSGTVQGEDQSNPDQRDDLRNPTRLPNALTKYASLLEGSSEAVESALGFDGLPPEQALTAALAMQEAILSPKNRADRMKATVTINGQRSVPPALQPGNTAEQLANGWRLLDRVIALTVPVRFAIQQERRPAATSSGDGASTSTPVP